MYETVKFLHSYWAYLVLLIVVLATVNSIIGMLTKKEFGAKDFRIALFALIVTHIQLLIGLTMYFMSPMYKNMKEFGVNKLNKELALEHPLLMVIAITLLTIGYSKHKNKRTSSAKFKTLAIPYALALVAMLAMIPWKAWLGL